MKLRKWPYEIDPSESAFRYHSMAAALSSLTVVGGRQGARQGRAERRAWVHRWREAGSWARSRGGPRVGPPPEGGRDLGEVARRAVRGTAVGGRRELGEGRVRDHRQREAGSWARSRGGPCAGPPPEGGKGAGRGCPGTPPVTVVR
jgi:hypothetical protein